MDGGEVSSGPQSQVRDGGQGERDGRREMGSVLRWGRPLLVDSCKALAPQELLGGGGLGARREALRVQCWVPILPLPLQARRATFDFLEP